MTGRTAGNGDGGDGVCAALQAVEAAVRVPALAHFEGGVAPPEAHATACAYIQTAKRPSCVRR